MRRRRIPSVADHRIEYGEDERAYALYTLRFPDVHTFQQLAEAHNVILGRHRDTRDIGTDVYANYKRRPR